ncbi:dicarboxylate/amino acid:cation symporter [Desulforamulus aeronauticus]|uniref:Na+/H+-dicarboxylate symporter n=1 Tax=Desulforamulus aeronauticus DSM 10349 TaxID=1121421 RepID=A0A1M6PJD1_9FIRM|nr:dicarboxylate/amino acid:cation symporter [Desulforamulus aeronauticus]SHK08043.1 Na+/H+-dicarboxylate symporter [Desulforamulus aeronauticus DSM 10349]
MKKVGLLTRLIIGLVLGIIVGYISKEFLQFDFFVRLLATFNGIFGGFLGYVIPLIIIGFVAPGIAELGKGAGRLLGITTLLAYASTIIAGTFAYVVGTGLLPKIVSAVGGQASNPEDALVKGFFQVDMPPIMGVMTALVTAFLFGLGMAAIKNKSLFQVTKDFQEIVEKVIQNVIIPLLPIHIAGIFANMTYAGEVAKIMKIFGSVFAIVIISHIVIIIFQYMIAGTFAGKNPFTALKNMVPAYLTAIGTQSSAATIPVTLRCAKKNGISDGVADFAVPLCATIHLSGSTITLTMCAMAVMMMSGASINFGLMFPFILMLGVTMVAAPGVPGGAVMAALGLLQSMLGFSEAQLGLMIALYLTQDSFGTACNVTGDGAIALLADKFARGGSGVTGTITVGGEA